MLGAARGAPGMAARGPARFGPWQWLLAAAGAAAAVWDAGADVWVAVGYARAGQPGCAALGLGLWAAGSAARQACSWLWFRSDPSTLRPELSRRPLAALHLLQLGFLYRYGPPEPRRPPRRAAASAPLFRRIPRPGRGAVSAGAAPLTAPCSGRCLRALRLGWRLCREEATEEERDHMAFLTHDISMLRLFETFLENAPQLAVLLYSVLRTNKAEPSQGAGPGMGGRGCAGLTAVG